MEEKALVHLSQVHVKVEKLSAKISMYYYRIRVFKN